jgi:hypothetical protein
MSTIHTTVQTGPDGTLKLEIPVGLVNTSVDVTVVVQRAKAKRPMSREERMRFIDQTAGKWQGEPLKRPEQPKLEQRDTWG